MRKTKNEEKTAKEEVEEIKREMLEKQEIQGGLTPFDYADMLYVAILKLAEIIDKNKK